MFKILFRSLLSLLLLLNLSACGVIDMFYLPPAEDTASEIFDSAALAMQSKEYHKAIQLYTKLQNDYPFSPYATEAELSLGDAYYLKGDYLDAAGAYKSFIELHPRNEAVPYVLYQTGMSLKNTNTSADRTATEAEEAILYFNRLMSSYPNNVYAQEAPKEIVNCRKILADHELYSASVFRNMGNYGAAYKRYLHVYEEFSDIPEVKEYSEEQAKLAFLKHTANLSEVERRKQYGSWHDYFKWL